MVGRRSTASLLLLAAAALAASHPATAQSQLPLFDPLDPVTTTAATPPAAGSEIVPPPAAATGPNGASARESSAILTTLAAPAVPAAALAPLAPLAQDDAEVIDPAEAAALPPAGAVATREAPVPAVLRNPPSDAGELGVEYELSVHDAQSFLGRLGARWKHLVEQAMTYLGTPYRRGGTSRSGVDCSGLTGAVYGEQGLDLPRTAAEQFREGVPVAENDLRPGDLVFFRDTYKRGISHVGIFIGDGRFLHAAGRRHGVIVSELARPYYHLRYAGARRPAADPGAAEAPEPDLSRTAANVAPAATPAAALAAAPR